MLANRIFVKLPFIILIILLWMQILLSTNVFSLKILMIFFILVCLMKIFLEIFSFTLSSTKNSFFLFFFKISSQKVDMFILFHFINFSFIKIFRKSIRYLFWAQWIIINFWFFLCVYVLKIYMSSSLIWIELILYFSFILSFF